MDLSGIYWMQFAAFTGLWEGGILVLEDGKIRGGNAVFAVVGRYRVEKDTLHADVVSTRYVDGPAGALRLGESLTLTLQGLAKTNGLMCVTGSVPGHPDKKVSATLTLARGLEMPGDKPA
jgi:hypothetical protein